MRSKQQNSSCCCGRLASACALTACSHFRGKLCGGPRRSARMAQRILSGVGSVLRQAGRAVDSFGASLQGKYAYRESCAPCLLLCVPACLMTCRVLQLAAQSAQHCCSKSLKQSP